MIESSKIETFGWEAAIRGMRNSFASWSKSDSEYEELTQTTPDGRGAQKTGEKRFRLGSNDLDLASRLAWCGGPEAKFRRMIHVQMDIHAPLYWWKEFDTYKVGTVANSTSTMHSIMKKEFTIIRSVAPKVEPPFHESELNRRKKVFSQLYSMAT